MAAGRDDFIEWLLTFMRLQTSALARPWTLFQGEGCLHSWCPMHGWPAEFYQLQFLHVRLPLQEW